VQTAAVSAASFVSVGLESVTITGFDQTKDKILLNKTILGLGDSGPLTEVQFESAVDLNAPLKESTRIIYDLASGYLFYDSDGSGLIHDPIKVATFAGIPELKFDNFFIA